jgi:hypothetical protein
MTDALGRGASRPGPRPLIVCITGAWLTLSLTLPVALRGQSPTEVRTRAERTGYLETSSYADVIAFLDETAGRGIAVDTFGYSFEGRALPVAKWGQGPTRVLVFANIHAGEVEGKEAAQILVRELGAGEHDAWRDSLTLWIAPIYNADGNERVSLDNRPLQHGPIGGMGQRPNAQNLDLNRDFMKLEAPETRSLVGVMQEFDPHVVVDLHTTNGTVHAYHLTYAPPLHPATDGSIDRYMRETWLPAVTAAVAPTWLIYHYGNLPDSGVGGADDPSVARGWYTFDHRPRFSTNYVGLRNRFGILSEAYSYLPFEERIAVTERFVEALLDFTAANGAAIRQAAAAADERSLAGEDLPLRAQVARSAEEAEVLLGEVAEERHPYTGQVMLRRLDVLRPERMPQYLHFQPTETERVPGAYLVPAALADAIEVLTAHGLRIFALPRDETLAVEVFRITGSSQSEREFQGHRERTLDGRWEAERRELPAGTVVVSLDQPLARLAFLLLEPRSDDGLVAWNFFDAELEGAPRYPVLRMPGPPPVYAQ